MALCLYLQSSLLHHKPRLLPARGRVWTFAVQALGVIRLGACFFAVTRCRACWAYILFSSTDSWVMAKLLALKASAWWWDVEIHIELLEAQSDFRWESRCLESEKECSCRLPLFVPVNRHPVSLSYEWYAPVSRWGVDCILDLFIRHANRCSPKFSHSLSCVQRAVGGDFYRDFSNLGQLLQVASIGLMRDLDE